MGKMVFDLDKGKFKIRLSFSSFLALKKIKEHIPPWRWTQNIFYVKFGNWGPMWHNMKYVQFFSQKSLHFTADGGSQCSLRSGAEAGG